MDGLLDHLAEVIGHARAQVTETLRENAVLTATDEQIVRALSVAAELQRFTDAVLVEATGEVARRSQQREPESRMTSRCGCHDVSELLQRATLLGRESAARLQRAARATMPRVALDGSPFPGTLPALRDALLDGAVGVDGVVAVAGPLMSMSAHVSRDAVLTADGVLAAEARGTGPDAGPAASADLLRVQARVWATFLDPDGAEPVEEKALRVRGVTLGRARDGVVPISGNLMVEVAAQFQQICSAITSPRTEADGPVIFHPTSHTHTDDSDEGAGSFFTPDDRTPAQKRHDALATALTVAASSRLLPTIGGAAATLVVSVREEDLAEGRGWAHIDGDPVSLRAATHAGCAGTIQRVLTGRNGRILKLGTEERVFNRHQRRAIALRDGGCLIPGCAVPAAWCEIHHVTEHAHGGPTHTDNGVLLCWYHHRHLDHHGWTIRITKGVPETLAPPWVERHPAWRPSTKSPTRLLNSIQRT